MKKYLFIIVIFLIAMAGNVQAVEIVDSGTLQLSNDTLYLGDYNGCIENGGVSCYVSTITFPENMTGSGHITFDLMRASGSGTTNYNLYIAGLDYSYGSFDDDNNWHTISQNFGHLEDSPYTPIDIYAGDQVIVALNDYENNFYVRNLRVYYDVTGSGTPLGASVSFDQAMRLLYENGVLSADLDTPDYVNHSYLLEVLKPDDSILTSNQLSTSNIPFTATITFDIPGSYEANLYECAPDGCSTFKALKATDSILIQGDLTTGTYVSFDQSKYLTKDTATITYSVSDAQWSFLSSYRIDILKAGSATPVKTFDYLWDQSGSYAYDFPSPGKYYAKLISHALPGVEHLLSETSATVQDNYPAYLYTSAVYPAGVNVSIGYMFTRSPEIQGHGTNVNLYYLDSDNVYKFESGNAVVYPTGANVRYYTNVTFQTTGKYRVVLYEYGVGEKDSAVVDSVFSDIPVQLNITDSYLTLRSENYMPGDYLKADYGIDNYNWSHYIKFFEIYNYNSTLSTGRNNIKSQAGLINFPLISYLNAEEAPMEIYETVKTFTPVNLIPGLNQLRLLAVNSTDTVVIIGKNFTLSSVNSAGYGLELSKYSAAVNEVFTIEVITPGTSHLYIEDSAGRDLKSWDLNTSINIPYSFNTIGTYHFTLTDAVGDLQVSRSIKIGTVPGPTPTPPGNPGDITDDYSGADSATNFKIWIAENFGKSPETFFLAGIGIIIMCAVILATTTKQPLFGVVGVFLGIFANVTLELWPMVWAVMFLVVAGLMLMGFMKRS